jgi:hypothetical protein
MVAKKKNPTLWEKAKSQAKAKMGGKHSARAMQLATKIYKDKGGQYAGKKSSANSMSKWTKQDWTTSSGKPSEGKRRYLPKKAWSMLSEKEKAATNRAKAEGFKKGEQFVDQPKKIAGKVKVTRHLRKKKNGVSVIRQHSRSLKDPKGGLSAAGRAAYKKEGHNLKPGVMNYSKASDADKKRWISWASRFYKNPTGPMEKDGKPTRLALTAAAWGEKVPKNSSEAKAIYQKAVKRKQQFENQ